MQTLFRRKGVLQVSLFAGGHTSASWKRPYKILYMRVKAGKAKPSIQGTRHTNGQSFLTARAGIFCVPETMEHVGCSRNSGPLMVIDYIRAPNIQGYQNGILTLGTTHA